MSKYYGSIQAESGKQVTKAAHRSIEAHVRGAYAGISARVFQHNGADWCELELTGGSHGPATARMLYYGPIAEIPISEKPYEGVAS